MEILTSFNEELSRKEFDAIQFINADGYHSKTIAYSIWHIFRIEDIVAQTLINESEQVFFAGNYQAVSYTHLDVYKIQPLRHLTCMEISALILYFNS